MSKSEAVQDLRSDLRSSTVPGSQDEGLIGRLENLEKRMKKVDKSIEWDSDDDDQYPGSVQGPWIDSSMLTDIRFLIRSARTNRKNYKAGTKSMRVAEKSIKEARKTAHLMTGGDNRLSATQLILEGYKARPIHLSWKRFHTEDDATTKTLLEPIHVLTEEPNVFQRSEHDDTVNIEHETDDGPVSLNSHDRYFPERIRIHSWLLTRVLNTEFDRGYVGWQPNGAILLRPYKSLVYHEPRLRTFSHKLRAKVHAKIQTGTLKLPETGDSSSQKEMCETIVENDQSENPKTPREPTEDRSLGDDERKDQNEEDKDSSSDDESDGEVDDQKQLLRDSATLLHLDCLLDFFDTTIQPRLNEIARDDTQKIKFDDLWNLFKPGDIVLEQGEKQAYRLVQVITPVHNATPPWARWFRRREKSADSADSDDDSDGDPVRLECVFLDFDGVQLGPVSKSFKIPRYEGTKPIKSLPVYGLRFSTNPELRQQLIARGKMLLDVATYKSMYYTGLSIDTKEEIDSQVVVDFSEALSIPENKHWVPEISPVSTGKVRKYAVRCVADCCHKRIVHETDFVDQKLVEEFIQTLLPQQGLDKPPLTIHPKLWTDIEKEGYESNDDELIIMTYRVFAFVLRSRKWAQLDLTHLKYESEENRKSIKSAFQRLVLPDGHKEMVEALVEQHFRGRNTAPIGGAQPDIIRGKGKGLIVLLHGAPGVGKTTTAEGVAEEFKRPLFQITCGDLGTTPTEVQAELERNFSLASRWGCVLLLDEADVFLAQRERKDLTRNALVAIFLRILEYYTGILFLTTNRVGDFDEAFASRIHMSLHYPALNAEKTKKVFKLNLELIQERMLQQGRNFQIDEDAILTFAEAHYNSHRHGRWNGRQIRNACQTALALAEYESKQETVFLMTKHFKKVQEAYLDFSRYLGETFGTLGDQRAHESQLRAEEPEYTPPDTASSIMRAEPSHQPSRVAPSPFRPAARQQAAPLQPNQPAYGAHQSTQPQGGQYMPSNQPPRTSQPQMGPSGHEQFGYQPQTWTAQPPMAQTQAQYPYQQQPTQLQPAYHPQGFVAQSHQQATDPSLNASANTDM